MARCLGVCGGVSHALQVFGKTASSLRPDERIYILHELVHNSCVTQDMVKRGAVFINTPAELPAGSIALIGAHGATIEEEQALAARAARLLDTTCPIVHQLHLAVAQLGPEDELVVLGQPEHQEVRGILSRSNAGKCIVIGGVTDVDALPELRHPALLCQTTLNHHESQAVFNALLRRFPQCRRLGATCRASQERQQAVEELVTQCDALVVVGSSHSANARRLQEIGLKAGLPAWLVNTPAELPSRLLQCRRIGVTAAASTTDELTQAVVNALTDSHNQS